MFFVKAFFATFCQILVSILFCNACMYIIIFMKLTESSKYFWVIFFQKYIQQRNERILKRFKNTSDQLDQYV